MSEGRSPHPGNTCFQCDRYPERHNPHPAYQRFLFIGIKPSFADTFVKATEISPCEEKRMLKMCTTTSKQSTEDLKKRLVTYLLVRTENHTFYFALLTGNLV